MGADRKPHLGGLDEATGVDWLANPRYTPQEIAIDGDCFVPNMLVVELLREWLGPGADIKPGRGIEKLKEATGELDDDTWMHLGQLLGWTVEDVNAMGAGPIPGSHRLLGAVGVCRPVQPLVFDHQGCWRFKHNDAVNFLLDNGPLDLNDLASRSMPNRDREQFAQLIGYSLDGFGTLSYASDSVYDRAEQEMKMRQAALEQALMHRDTPQADEQGRAGPRL